MKYEVQAAEERLRAHDAACATGEWEKSPFHLKPAMIADEASSLLFNHATAVLARAYLAATRADEGWRPIETAPKSSQSILVFCPEYGNTYIVCWRSWDETPGWLHFAHSGGRLMEDPTHWMPLPSPPAGLTLAEGRG
jgi:hypothetical protein